MGLLYLYPQNLICLIVPYLGLEVILITQLLSHVCENNSKRANLDDDTEGGWGIILNWGLEVQKFWIRKLFLSRPLFDK